MKIFIFFSEEQLNILYINILYINYKMLYIFMVSKLILPYKVNNKM